MSEVPVRPAVNLGHMPVEIAALCGCFVAVVALVARQTSVNAAMSCHAAAPGELLPTNIALVWFLVHVYRA